MLCLVFNGQPIYFSYLDFPTLDLSVEWKIHDCLCFNSDKRADTISAEDSDDDGFDLGAVNPVFGLFHDFNSIYLFFNNGAKVFFGFLGRGLIDDYSS
jgi:hypothetical protein